MRLLFEILCLCFRQFLNLSFSFSVIDAKIIRKETRCDDYSTPPPNFPKTIPLVQTTFKNWVHDIIVDYLWTATPASALDVVTIANWAVLHGFQVRASGYMHTWAPITVTHSNSCDKTILVKTIVHLTKMKMVPGSPAAVEVETGAKLISLLTFLEEHGHGLLATPATGDISVGGMLAINAHGTGLPAAGEQQIEGFTYGSLSNLVVSFEAVVWDSANSLYKLRTFRRSEIDAKAFLTNLGRAFLTKATLRVGPAYNLRCVSQIDIPASELFADPSEVNLSTRTFASFLERTGRVETIQYAFMSKPWLKVWSVTPEQPEESRAVTKPYNYPFSDNLPIEIADLLASIVTGNWGLAPFLGKTMYNLTAVGLWSAKSFDIWGPSKNLQLYVKASTLREAENGYAIITARSNVQSVVSRITRFYKALESEYAARGEYPINGPVEIRATGLDHPVEVGIAGAESPSLSAIRPIEGRPELDVALWVDILSFQETPLLKTFLMEFEFYLLSSIHDGVTTVVRPEWSKGWGYTADAIWANQTFLAETIPSGFTSSSNSDGWDWAVATLNKYDPNHVFSNGFLDNLLVSHL